MGPFLNPYTSVLFTVFIYNNSEIYIKPYSAFCICTYRSVFTLLPVITYLRYKLGANFTMISDSDPFSNMIISLSISVFIYTPEVSNASTLLPSCAYTATVMITGSVETISGTAFS